MINAVIELGDRRIHEVMVPRIAIVVAAGVVVVRRGDRPDHRARATRGVPVYETSVDEVVGILYAKDLLPFLKSDAPDAPPTCARCSGRRSSCPSR